MKSKKQFLRKANLHARNDLLYHYDEKYFNLWLNAWKWNGINREQREFIMRKFWECGAVASFPIIKPSKTFMRGLAPQEEDNGLLGFSTFAPVGYNMFNFPTAVTLINERAVPYIPKGIKTCNKDVVLGYAQHSRQPLRNIIHNQIERIVDVEMTIRTNLIAHKMPFVIKVGNQSLDKSQFLMDNILDDNPAFFVDVKDLSAIDSIVTGTPYIIDKLQNYKMALENELLTFLGIDNLSIEKKERLITDEANSNNDLINDFSDAIGSNLKEFCDLTNKTFGFNISVEPTSSPIQAQKEEMGDKEDDTEEL